MHVEYKDVIEMGFKRACNDYIKENDFSYMIDNRYKDYALSNLINRDVYLSYMQRELIAFDVNIINVINVYVSIINNKIEVRSSNNKINTLEEFNNLFNIKP